MLSGKTILLGVTGGIAAYKAAALASALVKLHASVEVVMTRNATQFITPLTFEQLTGNRTMVDTFDRNFSHQVEHIAPASTRQAPSVRPKETSFHRYRLEREIKVVHTRTRAPVRRAAEHTPSPLPRRIGSSSTR